MTWMSFVTLRERKIKRMTTKGLGLKRMMTASIVGLSQQQRQTELIHELSPAQREGGEGVTKNFALCFNTDEFFGKVSNDN